MDEQTTKLIKQLIDQMSRISQNTCSSECGEMLPSIQKKIDEAGILQIKPNPDIRDLCYFASLHDEHVSYGDVSHVKYFCFLPKNIPVIPQNPTPLPLYKVYGIDKNRRVVVVYKDLQLNIVDASNGNTIRFPFIIPA